jgi:CRP/FNR family transcriptional regulator
MLWSAAHSNLAAEVIQEAALFAVPREIFMRAADARPQIWRMLAGILASRERELEKRVSLLALRDVEYRLLYFLLELAGLFGCGRQADCLLPVTQKELASYVGATRETTSSTLNTLARRELVRLGRRLMVVPSIEVLQAAVQARSAKAAASSV